MATPFSPEDLYQAEHAARTGCDLPPQWLRAVKLRLLALTETPRHVWSSTEASSLHYISLYFPLRAGMASDRLRTLDEDLRELHVQIERCLWLTASAFAPLQSLSPREQELVELAFGLRKASLEKPPLAAWAADVATTATALRRQLAAENEVSVWPFLAAHYLSFFLDNFFATTLDVDSSVVPVWVARLSYTQPFLADASRVLSRWFSAPGVTRDAAGRTAATTSNRVLVPRTPLELLLLAHLPRAPTG